MRRKLNLIPLDDGAWFIFDIMRFIVLAVLNVLRLLRYIQIGRQLGSGPKAGMFIIGVPRRPPRGKNYLQPRPRTDRLERSAGRVL